MNNNTTNKSYIAYDDYNSTVTNDIIGTIRQTCSRNGLRNAVKLIEITKLSKLINIDKSDYILYDRNKE